MALLSAIESPALLIHGNPELGSMVLPEDAGRFVETIAHGHAVYVPNAGHSIHRERPGFLSAVVPFLLRPADSSWEAGTVIIMRGLASVRRDISGLQLHLVILPTLARRAFAPSGKSGVDLVPETNQRPLTQAPAEVDQRGRSSTRESR